MCYDQEKTQAPQVPGLGWAEANRSPHSHLVDPGFDRRDVKGCSRPMSSSEILAEMFSYHPPTPETLPKFSAINQAAKNFAEIVLQNCPLSADRSAAIRLIRDARMTANAAVALNGLSL